jgi:hypothetical protein
MRKQPRLLKDITQAALVRRQPDAAPGIAQHGAAHDDAPLRGPQQARHRVDDAGLARAGAAEQNGQAGRRHKVGVEGEIPKRMRGPHLQHQAPPTRAATRREIHSDNRSAPMATIDRHHDQPQRRRLAAGHLQEGIDRRGQRLRLAGNVGHEGDGGAEFAHGLGKAEDGARQHAGQDQRQGDRQKDPGAARPAWPPPVPAFGSTPRSTAAWRGPSAERP